VTDALPCNGLAGVVGRGRTKVPQGIDWKQQAAGGSFAITRSFSLRELLYQFLAAAFAALLPGVCGLPGQATNPAPHITFTKTLKGSIPEYVAMSIDATGAGTYDSHKLGDPPSPRAMPISVSTTSQIFALAQSLNDFRGLNLESRHRVANLGLKTLAYDAGNGVSQVQFNYTENRVAQQLVDIFERISNVEERIGELEYDLKYDHLSLPQTLDEIEAGMDEHNLVEASLLLPTLEKISANPHLLHLAQARAQDIMQRIQQNK